MKKLLLCGIAAATFATASMAAAADMPLKAPPLPVWSWTGVYVGGNVGYSWAHWASYNTAGNTNFPTGTGLTDTASPNVDGWVGGLQAGYNRQLSPNWLVGIEGDFQWSGEKASDPGAFSLSFPSGITTGICDAHPTCTATINTSVTNNWGLDWFATLRGRLGLIAAHDWLFYGTGGLAIAGVKYASSSSSTLTITNGIGQVFPGTPVSVTSGASQTDARFGYAIGGGVEKEFTPKWSVKAEYLYLGFGSHTFLVGTGFDTSVHIHDNILRVGLNYHLD